MLELVLEPCEKTMFNCSTKTVNIPIWFLDLINFVKTFLPFSTLVIFNGLKFQIFRCRSMTPWPQFNLFIWFPCLISGLCLGLYLLLNQQLFQISGQEPVFTSESCLPRPFFPYRYTFYLLETRCTTWYMFLIEFHLLSGFTF